MPEQQISPATSTANANMSRDESNPKMVFVGNLSYQTRESELRELCEDVGKVESCKIIFRGPRSQGYGFVIYETEQGANDAVEKLKGREFDGRVINVEHVVPRSERPSHPPPRRGGFFRGGFRGGRGSFRGGRGGKFGRRPRGPQSSTIIFVGNLPFKAVEDDLMAIFEGYEPVEARIVRRVDGASKGFGFVTVANEPSQKRAIQELNGAECDDRVLIIRAAFADQTRQGEENDEDAEN